MDLFETLKQFKNINPNAAYQEKSKRAVLAHTPKESWSAKKMFITIFETGVGVALTVFFILIIIGQFPGQSSVTPVHLSVINPATLRAEAQAVDMQIQLAQIDYNISTSSAESTPQTTVAIATEQPLLLATSSAATSTSSANGTSSDSTASSTLTVDQALQQLSQ